MVGRHCEQAKPDRASIDEASPWPARSAVAKVHVVLKNRDLNNQNRHNRKGNVCSALEDKQVPSTLDVRENMIKAVTNNDEGRNRIQQEAENRVHHAWKFSFNAAGVPDPSRLVDDVVLGLFVANKNPETAHRRTDQE